MRFFTANKAAGGAASLPPAAEALIRRAREGESDDAGSALSIYDVDALADSL